MKSILLFIPTIFSVKVTVNSNHKVKFIDEDSTDSEIILRCDFKVSPGIQDKFNQACKRNKEEPCAHVKWLAKGLPGPSRNQPVAIARPYPYNRVFGDYQTRFEVEPPYSLRLKAPIKHDLLNATYTCRVEVDLDSAKNEDSASFDLFVRVPPRNVFLEAQDRPQFDKPVNFTCKSDGQPAADFEWYFDGKQILTKQDIPVLSASGKLNDDSPEGQFKTLENGKILHIKKVMVGHKGQYFCKARNAALPEGKQSQVVDVDPTYLNMSFMFWGGAGLALLTVIVVLIILCCCCCKSDDNRKHQPGLMLHSNGYDPKTGRQIDFSSGRNAVTPAKSQLTQSTFGSGGKVS